MISAKLNIRPLSRPSHHSRKAEIMPWRRFIFTKTFWLTEEGTPDFLGYFYMSAIAALACWVMAWPAALFGYEWVLLFLTWLWMAVAAINFLFIKE